ncbi:HI1506-related protein [Desulfopila inferna]|uniref:HI1506-related protein n=1 Tax=Desulfopila inferna TaxID=468528 RepID=UPI001964D12A|nr:HI1506-related protein [Desulfopila inferna]MBM9605965.1 hypothetical protein [Desulfopila inferna]
MIRIRSLKNGFRRAGMAHTVEPREYADDFFSEKQVEALLAENMLVVDLIEGGTAESESEPENKSPEQPKATGGTGYPALSISTQLVRAILQLDQDKENAKHWTKSGVPQIDALEEISGLKDISAADRDTAYEIYLEGKK